MHQSEFSATHFSWAFFNPSFFSTKALTQPLNFAFSGCRFIFYISAFTS